MSATISPQQFVQKWQTVNLSERASYVTHFNDLCDLLGQKKPLDVDPKGEFFTFEKGVVKTSAKKSGQGWADVWYRGHFAWEYKRNHANLDAAYQQLLQYRESLENPPLLIVSDNQTIQIHTNFTSTAKKIYTFNLDDLLDTKKLDQLRRVFTDPDSFRVNVRTTAEVTEEAARKFSKLADILRKKEVAPDRAAHFLIRLLFCLFAEDAGLLPIDLFSRLVEATRFKPDVFASQLRQLFAAMSGGGYFGVDQILHFNGGLFNSDDVLELNSSGIEILSEVAKLDWSAIEPAILGTLFERSLDPSKRSQLGAHYTSKEDILLIVEPVLMQPLRRKWEQLQPEARTIATQRDAASGAARTNLEKKLTSLILAFYDEIANIQVLDPACGSGNFLYSALKQLLDLQKEVIIFIGELGITRPYPSVNPAQLHGIEINEYAHELAQATIWMGYLQWLRDNGFGQPAEPILKPLEAIVQMDAILAYDKQGQPTEPTWPTADIIIGNPPFLGSKRLRTELGDKYVNELYDLFNSRVPGEADLVCYWFEKARRLIETQQIKRVGLLATQGIRGGLNRKVLERIKETGDIFFAISDRNWVLDGAAVHVSMVGFDNGQEKSYSLNGLPVQKINPNLTGASDLTIAKRLQENLGIAFMGDIKVGPFDIDDVTAKKMLAATGNPNGRPNSDVIHPWINGLDITTRPRNMWIVDFGVDMPESEAALYEMPYEHILKYVKPTRLGNKMKKRATYWWIHGDAAPRIRDSLKSIKRFIATPRLTKHRLFVYINAETLPDGQIIVIARDDDYFLGVLHSKVHELWARGQGTQLREVESGFRYTPTTTFETFPFPWWPGKEPQDEPKLEAIAQAARELVTFRDNWLNPAGLTDEGELKKTHPHQPL